MVTRAPIRKLLSLATVMPRSSLMSLMFTNLLGETTSSFIRASRSVPPASMSASAQLLPSRLMACSLVVGLAYSNPRIAASLLFKRCQNSIRRQRQVRHPNPDCVGDGVGDHRPRRNGWRLAKPDHAALVIP